MNTWLLEEAKVRFCEVVKHAILQGPQEITEAAVVVISKREYHRLVRSQTPSFVKFIRQSPLLDTKIIFKRNKSPTRKL